MTRQPGPSRWQQRSTFRRHPGACCVHAHSKSGCPSQRRNCQTTATAGRVGGSGARMRSVHRRVRHAAAGRGSPSGDYDIPRILAFTKSARLCFCGATRRFADGPNWTQNRSPCGGAERVNRSLHAPVIVAGSKGRRSSGPPAERRPSVVTFEHDIRIRTDERSELRHQHGLRSKPRHQQPDASDRVSLWRPRPASACP